MYLLATEEKKVVESAKFTVAAIKSRFRDITVLIGYLKFVDVDSENAMISYMKLIMHRIREFRDKFGELEVFD